MTFQLRFPENEIKDWAAQYTNLNKMDLEDEITKKLAPDIKSRGYLKQDDLIKFSKWKSGGRNRHLVLKNSDEFIKNVTFASFAASDERFRIEVITLLDGVSWPTASAILHLCASKPYPILDFRALWSLNRNVPGYYDFKFWWDYTIFSREIADKNNVNIRTLDRALWQYSYENQGKL